MREIATMTFRWRARTLTGASRAASQPEELDRVLEARDLFRGLLGPGVQRLAVPVDPDDRHLELHARLDRVIVARGDVHPALLGADAPLALLEVRGIGLVGPHLLGGHHEVEVHPEVPPR